MGSTLSYFNNTEIPLSTRNKKGFGWIPDLPDHRDLFAKWKYGLELEDSIDLRESKHMPVIYNQYSLGSCTANAIAAAFAFEMAGNRLEYDPSRLFIYYNERQIEGTTEYDSGATIRDGMKCLNKFGVCPESDWPYEIDKFKEKPGEKAYNDALEHRLIEYRRVDIDVDSVKTALNNHHPVIFGMSVYESFMNIGSDGMMHVPKLLEKMVGGHAIMMVGYTDSHFIVRNSWGQEWGDKGYFYLPFEVFKSRYCSDAWILISET